MRPRTSASSATRARASAIMRRAVSSAAAISARACRATSSLVSCTHCATCARSRWIAVNASARRWSMAMEKSSSTVARRRSDSAQAVARSCSARSAASAIACSAAARSSASDSPVRRARGVGLRAVPGGLGENRVALRAGEGTDLGRLPPGRSRDLLGRAVRVGEAAGDLLVRAPQHVGDLVLGQPQHRAHALAHALHVRRPGGHRPHLRPQPVRPEPRLFEVAAELGGLVDGRVAVGDEDADLRVQPAQVGVDLLRVVTAPSHGEHSVGRGCDGFSGHGLHRTGRSSGAAGSIDRHRRSTGHLSPGRGESAFPARGRLWCVH